MAIDRPSRRVSWMSRIPNTRWLWLVRLAVVTGIIVSLSVYASNSGLIQIVAKVMFTAMIAISSATLVAETVCDVRSYDWSQLGRFSWMRHTILAAGILLALAAPWFVLTLVYPALQSNLITKIAMATVIVVVVFAAILAALAILLGLTLLLSLPIIIVRSRRRAR